MIKLSLEGLTSQEHEDNLYWSGSSYYQLIEGEFILVRIGQQKGNYRQLYLKNPFIKKELLIREHRLLAFNFSDFPEGYSKKDYKLLEVHHKDANKNNNSLDNLQILTKGEHSKVTSRSVSNSVWITTLFDNKDHFFQTTTEASYFLKRSVSKVGKFKNGGFLNGCYVKVEGEVNPEAEGLFHSTISD